MRGSDSYVDENNNRVRGALMGVRGARMGLYARRCSRSRMRCWKISAEWPCPVRDRGVDTWQSRVKQRIEGWRRQGQTARAAPGKGFQGGWAELEPVGGGDFACCLGNGGLPL